MPFWLHEPYFIRVIKGLSHHHRYIITIAAVSLSCIILLLFAYLPMARSLHQKKQAIEQLKQQKKLCQCNVGRYEQSLKQQTCLCDSFNQLCDKCQSFQKNISLTLRLLQEHDIACRDVQQKALVKKDFYKQGYVLIEGKSDFKKILSFLRDVEEQKLPVAFESFSLRRNKKGLLTMQTLLCLVTVNEHANDA